MFALDFEYSKKTMKTCLVFCKNHFNFEYLRKPMPELDIYIFNYSRKHFKWFIAFSTDVGQVKNI